MARFLRFNFQSGGLGTSLSSSSSGTSEIVSDFFAVAPAFTTITGSDRIRVEVDPLTAGSQEIVYITAWDSASPLNATIIRGQEGTSAGAHASGVLWQHNASADDLNNINAETANIEPTTTNAYPAVTVTTVATAGVANYGCWDGNNFWIGYNDGSNAYIYKIPANSAAATKYLMATGSTFDPLACAFDGRYIWYGSYDTHGLLLKFDTTTNTTVLGPTQMNPTGNGGGGIQDVQWDGTNIWLAIAQNGGTGTPGIVEKIDASMTVIGTPPTGLTNVNGLVLTTIDGTAYVWACCEGFVTQITASSYATKTISISSLSTSGYRGVWDGRYLWVADYYASVIVQIDVRTGAIIGSMPSATSPNSIQYDGVNLWTSGDGGTVTATSPITRAILESVTPSTTDHMQGLTYDGTNLWVVNGTSAKTHRLNLTQTNALTAANTGTPWNGTVDQATAIIDALGNGVINGILRAGQRNLVMDCNAPYTDFATTSTSLVNVPGLAIPIAAYERKAFLFFTSLNSSSSAGIKMSLSAPSGANGGWHNINNTTAETAIGEGYHANFTDVTAAFVMYAGLGFMVIFGTCQNSSTPGVIQFAVAKVTSGTATVYAISSAIGLRIN